jgi:hypothetical protein
MASMYGADIADDSTMGSLRHDRYVGTNDKLLESTDVAFLSFNDVALLANDVCVTSGRDRYPYLLQYLILRHIRLRFSSFWLRSSRERRYCS